MNCAAPTSTSSSCIVSAEAAVAGQRLNNTSSGNEGDDDNNNPCHHRQRRRHSMEYNHSGGINKVAASSSTLMNNPSKDNKGTMIALVATADQEQQQPTKNSNVQQCGNGGSTLLLRKPPILRRTSSLTFQRRSRGPISGCNARPPPPRRTASSDGMILPMDWSAKPQQQEEAPPPPPSSSSSPRSASPRAFSPRRQSRSSGGNRSRSPSPSSLPSSPSMGGAGRHRYRGGVGGGGDCSKKTQHLAAACAAAQIAIVRSATAQRQRKRMPASLDTHKKEHLTFSTAAADRGVVTTRMLGQRHQELAQHQHKTTIGGDGGEVEVLRLAKDAADMGLVRSEEQREKHQAMVQRRDCDLVRIASQAAGMAAVRSNLHPTMSYERITNGGGGSPATHPKKQRKHNGTNRRHGSPPSPQLQRQRVDQEDQQREQLVPMVWLHEKGETDPLATRGMDSKLIDCEPMYSPRKLRSGKTLRSPSPPTSRRLLVTPNARPELDNLNKAIDAIDGNNAKVLLPRMADLDQHLDPASAQAKCESAALRARKIRFDPNVQHSPTTKTTTPYHDMSNELRAAIWYSKQDLARIARDNRRAVREARRLRKQDSFLLRRQDSDASLGGRAPPTPPLSRKNSFSSDDGSNPEDQDYCIRGLEDLVSIRAGQEVRARKVAYLQAVLDEQARQKAESEGNINNATFCYDDERLRKPCLQASQDSRILALSLAQGDAREAGFGRSREGSSSSSGGNNSSNESSPVSDNGCKKQQISLVLPSVVAAYPIKLPSSPTKSLTVDRKAKVFMVE